MCVIRWLSFQSLGLLASCAFRIWLWVCGRLLVFLSCLWCSSFFRWQCFPLWDIQAFTLLMYSRNWEYSHFWELWLCLFLRLGLPSELLDIWSVLGLLLFHSCSYFNIFPHVLLDFGNAKQERKWTLVWLAAFKHVAMAAGVQVDWCIHTQKFSHGGHCINV